MKGFPAWHGGVGGLGMHFFVEGMCFENRRMMNHVMIILNPCVLKSQGCQCSSCEKSNIRT